MKRTTSTNSVALAFIAGAALTLGACQAKNEAPAPTPTPAPTPAKDPAMVRMIHAIPGGAAVDLYSDAVKLFTGIAYKTVTPYDRVTDTHVKFKLATGAAPNEPLAENGEMLSSAGHYTVIAIPGERGEGGELKVLTDETDPIKDGQARIRIINAVPDVKELEVGFKGVKDAIVSGLNSADDKGYRDAVPAMGTLEIRENDKKRVIASLNKIELVAGKRYTVLMVGRTTGTPKAEILLLEDGPAGAVATPAEAMPSATPAK